MNALSFGKFSKVFAAVVAAASLSAATYGQNLRTPVQVDVPFAFYSGDQQLNQGRYTIWMQSDHVTAVRGGSQRDFAMSNREEDLQPAKKSKIVFKKHDSRYFLSEVWIAGSKTHIHCLETKAKRETKAADVSAVWEYADLALVEAKR